MSYPGLQSLSLRWRYDDEKGPVSETRRKELSNIDFLESIN